MEIYNKWRGNSLVEKHRVFIKNGEVVGGGVDTEIKNKNIIASITTNVDSDEVQEVDKSEYKEIEKALKDDKKKVMIENGKPRIRLLDDKGKIK